MAHPRKQLLFVVLSLADLALTCWLLGGSSGQVYEANPVARWWLTHFGWAGMAFFKALVVTLVLGLTLVIARSRPLAAKRVLELGCVISALVVLYSATLLQASVFSPEAPAEEVTSKANAELENGNRQARDRHSRHVAFWRELIEDVADKRCTLREAAERLAASERGRDPSWRAALTGLNPGRPLQEIFAICVINHAVGSREGHSQAGWQLALRLEREFEHAYGSSPPLDHRVTLQGTRPVGGEDD